MSGSDSGGPGASVRSGSATGRAMCVLALLLRSHVDTGHQPGHAHHAHDAQQAHAAHHRHLRTFSGVQAATGACRPLAGGVLRLQAMHQSRQA